MNCSRSRIAEEILDPGRDMAELVAGMNHQVPVEIRGADNAWRGADPRQIAFEPVPVDENVGLPSVDFDSVVIGTEEHIAVDIGVPVEAAGRGAVGSAPDGVVPAPRITADEIVPADHDVPSGIRDADRHRSARVRIEPAVRTRRGRMDIVAFDQNMIALPDMDARIAPWRTVLSPCMFKEFSVAVEILPVHAGKAGDVAVDNPDMRTVFNGNALKGPAL